MQYSAVRYFFSFQARRHHHLVARLLQQNANKHSRKMMKSTSSSSLPSKRPRLASRERKRATKACDRCRRLKEKCEGGEPCGRCVKSRRVCAFSAAGATGFGISSSAAVPTTAGQRFVFSSSFSLLS